MTFKQMQRFCEDGCYECPFSSESFDGYYDEFVGEYEYETMCNIMYHTEEEIIAEYYKRFGSPDSTWHS